MRARVLSVWLALAALGGCGEERAGADLAALRRAEAARLGMPVEFTNDLGMRFVLVPAGRFRMGEGGPDESGLGAEAAHVVRLFSAYYAQVGKVTRGQWRRLRGEPFVPAPDDDRPVEGVTHGEAKGLAADLTARDPLWIYRLPSEAEWERAAALADVAGTHAAPGEWCRDWQGPFGTWEVMNPTGPSDGERRVVRGGVREPHRDAAAPDDRAAGVGLRLTAKLSYGKSGLGACDVTFVTVDADDPDPATREHPDYDVRVVAVIDRLTSRQEGVDLPWVTLPDKSSPVHRRMPPGRYYAIAVRRDGTDEIRGLEAKFELDQPTFVVRVPIPKPGAMLRKPQ